ncbi:MAG: minor capsid protein [Devosia sp.]
MANAVEISQEVYDRTVIHEIDVRRYASRVVNEMLDLLNEADKKLTRQLYEMLGNEPQKTRIEQRLAAIRKTGKEVDRQSRELLEAAMTDLAGVEGEWNARVLRDAGARLGLRAVFDAPTTETLAGAVLSKPFQGRFLKDWAKGIGDGRTRRIQEVLRRSYVEGMSVDETIKAIRGTRWLNYKDGILEISRRGAAMVVRTALTHTTNTVVTEVAKKAAEDGIVRALRWSSILDGRTSPVCRGRDGKVYPLDKGPRPPAHPSCRSRMAYVFTGEPDEPRRETYQSWLKRQPAEAQDQILGKRRGQLFRKGEHDVTTFVDLDGRQIPLEELKRRSTR